MVYNIDNLPSLEKGDLIIPTSISKAAFRQNVKGFRLLFEMLDVMTQRFFRDGEYALNKSEYNAISNPSYITDYPEQILENRTNKELCEIIARSEGDSLYCIDVPVNRVKKLFNDLDELDDFVKNNDCLLGIRDFPFENFEFAHYLFGNIIKPTDNPFQKANWFDGQLIYMNDGWEGMFAVVTPVPDYVRFTFYYYFNVPVELSGHFNGACCWIRESREASIVRKSDVMTMRNPYAIKLYLLVSTFIIDEIYTWTIPDLMVLLGAMCYDIEEKEIVNADDVTCEKDFTDKILPKAVEYINKFCNPRTNKTFNFTTFYSVSAYGINICVKRKGTESPFPPKVKVKKEICPKAEVKKSKESKKSSMEITQEEIDKEKERLKRRKYKKELFEAAQKQLQEEGIFVKPETIRGYIPKQIKDFVWIRDGGRCVYCGSKENLVFDHIIPVAQGGATVAENLQILCRECNADKRDHIGEL